MEADLTQILQLIGVMLAAGLLAGFVAGLFGIGGGFVIVPALLLVFHVFDVGDDVLTHLAIGTSLATIIFTSLRSVQAHNRKGAVDFQIIKDWLPWLLFGVVIGIVLARFMDGRSMKWIFSAGVFLMGLHFLFPVLKRKTPGHLPMPTGLPLAAIATFLGGFSALLGIGGGTIAVLVMTWCGRPIHQAVGTAAGFGVIIALPGSIGFAILGLGEAGLPFGSLGYVNLIAVAAISTMTFISAPIGVHAAHKLPAEALKRVFGLYLVATSAIVLYDTLPK
ncbi:sulfite exporter TauE/SafE family protein [Henriciella aquimarina]|uniref:sulfite exporter TauE/SafE family protein n=1 Tax=Henriciella aquimarina TaxID=545261 RepID=UPI0009FC89E6